MSIDLIQGGRKIIAGLTMSGLWPTASDAKWYVRVVPWLVHVPLTFGFVLLMVLKALLDAEGTELVNLLYILLTELGMAVKMFNFYWYKDLTMQTFTDWESNSMFALRTPPERVWWRREHRTFVIVMVSFFAIAYFSFLCSIAPDIYYRTMRLPFQLWLPRSLQHADYYYYMVGYEVIAMSWNCICNTMLDIYNCYISFHLSLIYRLLELRIQAVGRMRSEESNYEYTVEIIELQRKTKQLSNDCDHILCWPMLFQVFLSTFVLCFSAYRLQNLEVDEQTVGLFAFPYLIAMVLQIYLPCYYGNEVTLSSERLCTSLYSSHWIELQPKHRRLLLVYMVYLNRPVVLRAGGFFAIGLPLFSKVINNAYSLLALLLNMDN